MRTTLTLDADVLSAARDLAARQGNTIGQVISDLARQTLLGTGQAGQADQAEESFYGFRPLPRRGVIVTNDLINAIRETESI